MRAMNAIVAALALAAASAQLINRWVPGICSSDQLTPSVGVGCGIIASDLKAYAPPSTASIRPIVQNVLCDLKCYFPGHETDPDCQYCVYVDHLHNNTAFKVPKNVFVMPWTGSDTCFENSIASSWDDVTTVIASSHEHNGFFHWSSTVTEKFLQRFFKSYASLSLFVQRYVFASIVLMPGQVLDQDFETRISLLPTKYSPATKDNFFEFIENYGTHYIDSAFTGGVAVLTSYFESCLSTTFSGQWVYHESGSSFFGIFNHDHKHASGYNHTSKMYQENSNSTVNLYGGNGAKWGDFNWTRPVAANFSAAWAETIYPGVGASWRKPRGIDNPVRRRFRGNRKCAKIGFGSDKKTRHLTPTGFKKFLIRNPAELEILLMNNRTYAAEIASNISARTKASLVKRA